MIELNLYQHGIVSGVMLACLDMDSLAVDTYHDAAYYVRYMDHKGPALYKPVDVADAVYLYLSAEFVADYILDMVGTVCHTQGLHQDLSVGMLGPLVGKYCTCQVGIQLQYYLVIVLVVGKDLQYSLEPNLAVGKHCQYVGKNHLYNPDLSLIHI